MSPPNDPPPDPGTERAVLEFLALWLSERESGEARTLAEYQALFPGHAAALAAEWSRSAEAAAAPEGGGTVVGFRLVRELGRGGQAHVWLAEDLRLGRAVALKLVPRSPFSADLAPRLAREARAASRLDHPGLCAVYDAGVDGAVAWIALRYVEGETLAARIARARPGGQQETQRDGQRDGQPRCSIAEVLAWGEALARALHVAHSAGIIHRDVKPANVMLGADGNPVLLDFGVALDDDAGAAPGAAQAPLTLNGDILGTPQYMAPERHAGARASVASDVWSLGATLYEALALERPFQRPTLAAERRAADTAEFGDLRARCPKASRDLIVVLHTALAPRPADRYATALDLAEDLARVRRGEPVHARPLGPLARLGRWCARERRLAASLGLTLLALAVGGAVSGSLWLSTRAALRESQALFRDVEHLADSLDARRLVESATGLWPARSARHARFAAWLADAERLAARRDTYEEVLAATRAREASGAPRPTDPWLAVGLEELVARLAEVAALTPRVAAGAALAESLHARTVVAAQDAWAAAAADVARDPRFAGFTLTPVEGLIPLGPDPASGLQEFAHVASGAVPARDAATGALAVSGETGIVLVLVPGGEVALGARPASEEHPVGSPFVDPYAWRWDGPHLSARLDPYWIGKYELTQGQWLRATGERPAAYGPGSTYVGADADRHPIEEVSAEECLAVLASYDLTLPSEAQWDRAARAGTASVWWTGDVRESLAGAANVADRTSMALGGANA